ncbi:MAG: AraC family transcriptional regulator [Planctomycetota bacterium]|nr:AraC family transcriptional regulator [Planctomycetota bacterium]
MPARKSAPAVRRLRMDQHLLRGAEGLPLSVRWHDVNAMVGAHDHDFHEIALITQGRGDHFTSRRRVLTAAGDVWIIRPGHWHTYFDAKHLGVFNCLIGAELFRELSAPLQRAPGAVELFWRGPARQARDGCCLLRLAPGERLEAQRLLERLAEILADPAPAAQLAARGLLWQFLALLAGAAEKRLAEPGAAAEAESAAARPQVAVRVLEILEQRYAEPLVLADLASAAGVSAPHLNRLFRRLTGQPPLKYLQEIRIQRACLLLAGSDRPITEVAGKVGWPDPNLFARRFRQLLGVSPRQYREARAEGRRGKQ